jgi:hypothetical protein
MHYSIIIIQQLLLCCSINGKTKNEGNPQIKFKSNIIIQPHDLLRMSFFRIQTIAHLRRLAINL